MSALARTLTGDIALPLAIATDPTTLARNKLIDQFNLWEGEWFADTRLGFPWIQRVISGAKAPSMTQLRALLHRAILKAPGVVAVNDIGLVLNPKTRGVSYSFEATLSTGDVVIGGAGAPYIVDGSAS